MRGEGNHKIPASFAPENMEKTGAERVKYSLACQHEDAIPIKFVPYAQKCPTVLCTFAVALRKESVDRNAEAVPAMTKQAQSLSARRAWIEMLVKLRTWKMRLSLSARRAWIEILKQLLLKTLKAVALRKESVDRNSSCRPDEPSGEESLSARRAWIEIRLLLFSALGLSCRSPQGERG